jgi:hypothetical protein
MDGMRFAIVGLLVLVNAGNNVASPIVKRHESFSGCATRSSAAPGRGRMSSTMLQGSLDVSAPRPNLSSHGGDGRCP